MGSRRFDISCCFRFIQSIDNLYLLKLNKFLSIYFAYNLGTIRDKSFSSHIFFISGFSLISVIITVIVSFDNGCNSASLVIRLLFKQHRVIMNRQPLLKIGYCYLKSLIFNPVNRREKCFVCSSFSVFSNIDHYKFALDCLILNKACRDLYKASCK